jgi:hypothetical protein
MCSAHTGELHPTALDFCERPLSTEMTAALLSLRAREGLFKLLALSGIKVSGRLNTQLVMELLMKRVLETPRGPSRRVRFFAQNPKTMYTINIGSTDMSSVLQDFDLVTDVDLVTEEPRAQEPARAPARTPEPEQEKEETEKDVGRLHALRLAVSASLSPKSPKRSRDEPDRNQDEVQDEVTHDQDQEVPLVKRLCADELIGCPSCHHVYDFVNRIPQLVHACGHTLCAMCVGILQSCPVCRTSWGPEPAFTVNQSVQDALLLRRKSKSGNALVDMHELVHAPDHIVERVLIAKLKRLAIMRYNEGMEIAALRTLDTALCHLWRLPLPLEAGLQSVKEGCLESAIEILMSIGEAGKAAPVLSAYVNITTRRDDRTVQNVVLWTAEVDADLGFAESPQFTALAPTATGIVGLRAHIAKGHMAAKRDQPESALYWYNVALDAAPENAKRLVVWHILNAYLCGGKVRSESVRSVPLSVWDLCASAYVVLAENLKLSARQAKPERQSVGVGRPSFLLARALHALGRPDEALTLVTRALTAADVRMTAANQPFKSAELREVQLGAPAWWPAALELRNQIGLKLEEGPAPKEVVAPFDDVTWIEFCRKIHV